MRARAAALVLCGCGAVFALRCGGNSTPNSGLPGGGGSFGALGGSVDAGGVVPDGGFFADGGNGGFRDGGSGDGGFGNGGFADGGGFGDGGSGFPDGGLNLDDGGFSDGGAFRDGGTGPGSDGGTGGAFDAGVRGPGGPVRYAIFDTNGDGTDLAEGDSQGATATGPDSANQAIESAAARAGIALQACAAAGDDGALLCTGTPRGSDTPRSYVLRPAEATR